MGGNGGRFLSFLASCEGRIDGVAILRDRRLPPTAAPPSWLLFMSQLSRIIGTLALAAVMVVAVAVPVRAADSSPDQLKFFEEKIRPLLVERCYECHTADKHQGDVRLDLREAVFPHLIAPGQPDQSRLIQVLRYDPNDTQMPPKGKLPPAQLELLTEWVKQAAPWPADAPTGAKPVAAFPRRENGDIDFHATAQTHWAYRAITRPVPPTVATLDRVHSPVDRFILARLEPQQLALSPEADRATLIRRLYADLLGIRPTFEEVEAYVADPSPTADEDLVDRQDAAMGRRHAPVQRQRSRRYGMRHQLDRQ